jgi:uncharacterized cofD-like protein
MSTRHSTLPEQSRSNNGIVVLGAGRGLASVLRALRGVDRPLTVIVSIAYEGEQGDDAEQRLKGEGVGDLRRSLEALSGEEGALARAIRRPLTIARLGRHPLGNLTLASAAAALGDYGQASLWLGQQLGIDGAVLPATIEPARRQIEMVAPAANSKATGGPGSEVSKLRLVGDAIQSPEPAVEAIEHAKWVLLAPGGLYRSVLSTAAVPDVAGALRTTSARVVWIANLAPGAHEGAKMTATDHLDALRLHAVRVDVVLHDPSASLKFDPADLAGHGVESVSRALRSRRHPAVHDPDQLRSALATLIGSRSAKGVRSRRRG